MIAQYGKRALSLFLAMIMVLSVVPVQAFAQEVHDHQDADPVVTSEPTEASAESGESEALIALRAGIADYIQTYGLTADMPDSVLEDVYFGLYGDQIDEAWSRIEAMIDQGLELPEEERELLLEEQNTKLVKRFYEVMRRAQGATFFAAAQTFTPAAGVSVQVGKDYATAEMSEDGTITVTATGTKNSCGEGVNEVTIIIANDSAKKAIISFSWDKGTCTVRNDALGTESVYTKTFEADEVFQFTVQSPKGKNTGTFKMFQFTCEEVQGSIDVTFEYDNTRGSVTHNGEAVESGAVVPVASSGATLQATATGNNQFLAWVDGNDKVLSRDATLSGFAPDTPMVVKAVFASTEPVFLVDNTYVVKGLNEAVAKGSQVVLLNNAVLPAGSYTIPSGVTLLIPYDAANTLHTTVPGTLNENTHVLPTAYRTLTMAEGAHIVVNGALSLSARQNSSGGKSAPYGPTSFINMHAGSSITVNSGGNLYAWGYITGSGAVTVKNGGTVYECFQVMDWRGGDNTSGMVGNANRVFPFSQYYVQNVEVPMTLEAGATENGYMSIAITLIGIQGAPVPFIGANGMFNITNGHIVKDYDETTGRLMIDVYGALSVKSLSIKMNLGLAGTKTINSKDYVLPINGNITVAMHSGGSIDMTQDIALQPGAKLIIDEGASCTLGSGNKIYVYDYDQWTTEVAADAVQEGPSFCGTPDATHINLPYPASAKTVSGRSDDAYVEVNGTADLSAGFAYTTASGASICGTGTIIMKPGTETAAYQVKNIASDNKTDKWITIPITSAKLMNADGSYTETAGDAGKVIYKFINGKWSCEHTYAEGTFSEAVTTPATCEGTGVKTITCHCGEASKTEEIAALGHDYEAVVTAPTCTQAGYTTHTCKNGCGSSYTDSEQAALGHDEVSHEAKAPTCTEIGWDAYVTCSKCDYSTYVEKEALGHDEVSHAAKAATCTEIGWDAYVTCSRCDYSTYAEKASLGHDEVSHEAKAPTCTEIGWDAYVTCTRCDYSTYAEKAALGHDEVSHEAKAPTCTEIGWDAYVTCNRCDYTTYEEKAALGHDEVSHAAKAPTCTEIGWDAYVTCNRCDYTTYAEKAALGHSYSSVVTDPTCTEGGYTTHTCPACGHSYTDSEKAALGHAWVWITDQEATVLEPGVKHEECATCREKRNENTEIPILKCSHTGTMEITPAKAATCTENGNSRYSYCSACRNYYSDDAGQHEIEKDSWIIYSNGHDEVAHAAQAPTCTEIGWDAYVTCSKCDYTTYAEKAALGHDEVSHEAQAPTCTEIGWDSYVTCTRCDYTTYVEKAALGHDEVSHAAQAPTCTEIGWEAYVTCSRCDYTTYAETAALGHDEVAHQAQAPTCTEIGWDAYVTCNRCDYTTYAEKAALGHDEVSHEAQAPTCTEIGWDAYVTCTRCDYTTYAEKAATGHLNIVEVEAVAATCQKEGIIAHWRCDDCGMTFADEAATEKLASVATPIDPDNHTWAETGEETKATCQAEGKVVYPCVNDGCEQTKEETLPIDPDGHVWDEGEPYKVHSCNSASYMRYRCTLCNTINDVVVREQHFRIPIAEEIPATCTEDGMTSGWKCEKCDEFWIPQEVIPALGHDWNGNLPCQSETSACTRCDLHFDTKQDHLVVIDPAVSATCTETGLTEGSHCGYCGQVLVAQTETPVTDHNWIVADMEIPASCDIPGHKEGARYCLDCNFDEDPIPALEHEWMHRDAKKATYSAIGWNAHDYCLLCKVTKPVEQYESDPCEYCGENPEGYIEIPMVEIQRNATLDDFLTNIGYLEMMAQQYALEHPGTDPLALVLNYMRTAVENYTTGSWAIMAGPEDKDFLKYVQTAEDAINSDPNVEIWVNVSGLKKLKAYNNTHDELNVYTNSKLVVMSGHFFGTMDMTYHNKGSQNHADVGGWVGDLTDLLSTSDELGVDADLTLEEKIAYIRQNYLFSNNAAGSAGSFGSSDLYADLDAYFFMNELITKGYNAGDLERMMRAYYQPGLTLEQRVSYLLTNRLDGLSIRKDLRTAVYNAYTGNKLIATLEGTRNFNATGSELAELRKAVCYAFADEICRIAGDYVEDLTNPRFTVFDSETKILAPGISQQISYATNADGKQIVFYVATADVARDDVGLWVNYYDRDPGTPENPVWKNNSVPSSAQNAQDRYGDPASEDYIENFNVIASTNAGGYDMSDVATPGGLVVMNGIEWYPQTNTAGFFAILDDGTAYMGTYDEYALMKDRIQEAIGGFGEFVVKDGKVVGNAAYSDAPRTSVGITSTGRVVIMCIDGRQAPFSSGASLQDVGYIMKEAGCVVAINLDGGGSTTFVARQPGSDELTVMNRPSDGYPRNVSTNLLLYSTAPSSTAFDHAVIESEYDYATVNTPVQMTAAGVSPSGNAVDIPEGAVWSVSDENWASVTADGVFTGKRLGEVTVYLMLDGEIIGSKLMTLTTPDQIYFEKSKVDAIYGSSVTLPLRARTGGKPIAINPNDVTFALSAPAAGTMDGFAFKAAESAVKTLSITASIGETISASINVMLYQQGENSFDFDKATGGDRMLAWDRQVSNAKVEDGSIYNVIDPAKDMVTSYTFALDMTAIPIPERLEELTYMLPGGTMEGANAWSFLLSLAQRISDLTWVKATVDFDDRFVVDYSEMKVLNDYFALTNTEFDETTNTLTVTLNWIKQSQVIDEATANPLCLINGIKLTPKDGAWEDTSKINAVTSGTIGYEIYMRASGLYSFSQKPENQAVFGLYPYRNPSDTADAGGYFRDTYAQITDEYTLVNAVKEGWVNEEGGFAYYVEGERLTGVQQVEGFYYDFGEEGINVGQTKLTGMFYQETEGAWYYSCFGELANGWQLIGGDWYYFSPKNNRAVSGYFKIAGVKFHFEDNGKLTDGVWVNTLKGTRYYYGPNVYWKSWQEIDGELYYFEEGYRVSGYHYVSYPENISKYGWAYFDENGRYDPSLGTGIYEIDGTYYYFENGFSAEMGLICLDGEYYFTVSRGRVLVDTLDYYAYMTNCDMPCGRYSFDAEGKMIGSSATGEVALKNGVLYYFERGTGVEKGLIEVDGDYYFTVNNGRVLTNVIQYAYLTNCDLPCGRYEFGADGKMLQGIVEKDGIYYYYENGVGVEKGLIEVDGDYYFTAARGRVIQNEIKYVYLTNCDLPCGRYEFGPDGKMVGSRKDGEIVVKGDTLYYYEKGVGTEKGLVKVDGDYYFTVNNGRVLVDVIQYAYLTNCDLPCGRYEFGADGKMLQGIIDKDGTYYYFENGVGVEKGLIEVDGAYYFTVARGRVIVNETQYVYLTNCDMPCAKYEFGADGKMIGASKTGELVAKDGTMYYYENGAGIEKGLICIDGAYYFTVNNGRVIVNETQYVYLTNCDMPCGTYEFGADGKMIGSSKTGEIVVKDGTMYYYESGAAVEKGLICLDGDYYFTAARGRIIVNKVQYASLTSCDLPCGRYEFDADGKMIGSSATGELINKDGVDYYYEKGQKVNKGLVKLDGEFYYIITGGKVVKSKTHYVSVTNDYLPAGNYDFDADGKMIGSSSTGEIVNRNGVLYYYENGVRVAKGLVYIDNHYYFASTNGRLAVNCTTNVWEANGLLIEGYYTFNELGQLVG